MDLVLQLDNLRSAASSEFELRGPFPSRAYERIMDSTNKMLDAFHAMNVVIQKDLHTSEGETLLLKYTAEERADLCFRISHLFQGRPSIYCFSQRSSLIVTSPRQLSQTRVPSQRRPAKYLKRTRQVTCEDFPLSKEFSQR